MGNCLRCESAVEWGGDNWGSPAAWHGEMSKKDMMMIGIEEEEPKGFVTTSTTSNICDNYSSTTTRRSTFSGTNCCGNSSTEVKIKVTKRQLEELLGKVDVRDLCVKQMLAQLISVSHTCESHQLRSWRPALQSIPESD